MAQITAKLVKELRESTGVGMMDCKKALTETDGDIQAAVDWLRTKGLAKAAKKADRVAAEGLVGVTVDGTRAAIVEVNAETDFVARNEIFQKTVSTIAKLALDNGNDVEALGSTSFSGSDGSVVDHVTSLVASIGENMSLRRSAKLEVTEGHIGSYIHTQIADGLGRIGVLVALESTGDAGALKTLGRNLAMHIAASAPQSISSDDLDPDMVERERAILTEQAKESGKPDNVVEKMVEGRLRKFYADVCLLSQPYVIDGENSVGKAVELAGKEMGAEVKITGFQRFALGEGIEKAEEDFAAEVAATIRG